VNDKTNGKITELISDSDFLAYLVNAVYFKGGWQAPFDAYMTEKSRNSPTVTGKRVKFLS
jgi:serine protease inhibitor